MPITDPQIISDLISRRIDQVIPGEKQLEKLLLSGKKLRIYQGFDPTSPNLHIGHLVGILTLAELQKLGHEIIFLIGDFTATIGDPSGKDKTRQPLTRQQVLNNCKSYQSQIKNILAFDGPNPTQIRYNSEWLSKMNLEEVLQFAMNFTAQQMIERDMFQQRLNQAKPISLHEFFYPVLVTKDAIALDVDIELGGSDQLFNMSIGRHLIRSLSGKNKFAITTPLLTDSAGRKMGKSEGNAIALDNPPEQFYGQIMSLTDDAIVPCFRLISLIPSPDLPQLQQLTKTDPMQAKKKLAWTLLKMLQGETAANQGQTYFENTFQKGQTPDQLPSFPLSSIPSKSTILEIISPKILNLTSSNSDARRKIEHGAIKINGQKITDPNFQPELNPETIIQVGKHKFIKII